MGKDWQIIGFKTIKIPASCRFAHKKSIEAFVVSISDGEREFKAFGLTKVDAAARAFRIKDDKGTDEFFGFWSDYG